jgi:hypothetical protein
MKSRKNPRVLAVLKLRRGRDSDGMDRKADSGFILSRREAIFSIPAEHFIRQRTGGVHAINAGE